MSTKMSRPALVAGALAGLLALSGCGSPAADGGNSSPTSKEGISVALSNGFVNGWRQTLIRSFEKSAEQLKSEGVVKEYQTVNAPGDNSATEQASQIRSLILQKPDVLMVIPASSTALVPVVQEACDADIKVIVLDADMDIDCAHIVRNAYDDWGAASLEPALKAIGDKGTVVINRGVVGSQPEELFHKTQLEILKTKPNVKVAAEINGFCDSSTAQQELVGIIGSLPKIDAVPGCIGGMGIVQAFEGAGKDVPAVVFDTDGKSLKFWKDKGINNGSFAALTDPGQSVAALHVAVEIVKGNDVPRELILPLLVINEQERDAWLKNLGPDDYAAYPWDKELVAAAIEATKAGKEVKAPSVG